MEEVEVLVVGAGVIGLSIARQLALLGHEVVVAERADAIGTETSSRNSEVIHAGIYYPAGSLMARFCVSGKQMLYAYCAERGLAHRRCGKLIVATDDDQVERLNDIRARAGRNGVALDLLGAGEVEALEPELRARAALFSSSTGILDSHGYMLSLQGDAEANGAAIAFNCEVVAGRVREQGFEIETGGAGGGIRLRSRMLINAAGLSAPEVARRVTGQPEDLIPQAYYAKGQYFVLAGRSPFSHLIYPIPEPGGLGVHLTLDLDGRARFGPDVTWVDQVDYSVDAASSEKFYGAVRRYWPGLPDDALLPGYAGIRPKIVPPAQAVQDFMILGPRDHGVDGLVNLFGIESPGLTASLAVAAHVADLAVPKGNAAYHSEDRCTSRGQQSSEESPQCDRNPRSSKDDCLFHTQQGRVTQW